jgi:hypothetical protein
MRLGLALTRMAEMLLTQSISVFPNGAALLCPSVTLNLIAYRKILTHAGFQTQTASNTTGAWMIHQVFFHLTDMATISTLNRLIKSDSSYQYWIIMSGWNNTTTKVQRGDASTVCSFNQTFDLTQTISYDMVFDQGRYSIELFATVQNYGLSLTVMAGMLLMLNESVFRGTVVLSMRYVVLRQSNIIINLIETTN